MRETASDLVRLTLQELDSSSVLQDLFQSPLFSLLA